MKSPLILAAVALICLLAGEAEARKQVVQKSVLQKSAPRSVEKAAVRGHVSSHISGYVHPQAAPSHAGCDRCASHWSSYGRTKHTHACDSRGHGGCDSAWQAHCDCGGCETSCGCKGSFNLIELLFGDPCRSASRQCCKPTSGCGQSSCRGGGSLEPAYTEAGPAIMDDGAPFIAPPSPWTSEMEDPFEDDPESLPMPEPPQPQPSEDDSAAWLRSVLPAPGELPEATVPRASKPRRLPEAAVVSNETIDQWLDIVAADAPRAAAIEAPTVRQTSGALSTTRVVPVNPLRSGE